MKEEKTKVELWLEAVADSKMIASPVRKKIIVKMGYPISLINRTLVS